MIQENVYYDELKFHINELIQELFYKNQDIDCCPICGGKHYIKYGSYKGIQRYKCKSCNKTFSKNTNSLWSYSKKDLNLWIEFIELMMKRKSLRFSAKKLNITLVTAFYWRHKILNILKSDSIPSLLKGDVHINKTILKENFKGSRHLPEKRRNIWVFAARGEEDTMLAAPAFADIWNWKLFNQNIYSKIDKEAYIVPYGDRLLKLTARKHNNNLRKEVPKDMRIQYIKSNLEKWLEKFKGVATKYLKSYLSFYVLFYLDKTIDYVDFALKLYQNNSFIKTQEIKMQELVIC